MNSDTRPGALWKSRPGGAIEMATRSPASWSTAASLFGAAAARTAPPHHRSSGDAGRLRSRASGHAGDAYLEFDGSLSGSKLDRHGRRFAPAQESG